MCEVCKSTIDVQYTRPARRDVLDRAAAQVGGVVEHYEDASTVRLPHREGVDAEWRAAVLAARVELPHYGNPEDLTRGAIGMPTQVRMLNRTSMLTRPVRTRWTV